MVAEKRYPLTKLPDGDPKGLRSFATSLLIASSAMMFGGLVLLYLILRADAPIWPPVASRQIPRLLPNLATVVILLSSVTMEGGVRSLRQARPWELRRWLGATFFLGVCFLLLISWLWLILVFDGFSRHNPHGGMFYVLTAFHGVHVIGAISLVGWLIHGARRGRYHGRESVAVRMVGRFWHFLGVGWVVIYLSLFAT